MRHCRRLITICLCATVLPVSRARASLVPDLDLKALASNSDLIAVGHIAGVREDGLAAVNIQGNILPARVMLAELDLERLLKGQSKTSTIIVRFSLPHAPVGYAGIPAGQFGVFFLRKGQESYEVLDPYHPFVVATPGAPTTGGTYLDQVTAELAYVVTSPEAPVQARRKAVEALSTLLTSGATTVLQTATRDRNPVPRGLAIAALLERGDIAWIDPAANILLSGEQGLDGYLVWRLAVAIEGRVKDPKAVPTLVRLFHSSDVTVRRAAAAALRNTQHPSAIPPLIQALYDTDENVRYSGVIGLAEITGTIGEWAPAYDTFLKDQAKYLTHWQDWAKSRK